MPPKNHTKRVLLAPWNSSQNLLRSAIISLRIALKIRYSFTLVLGMTTVGVVLGLSFGEWQQRRALAALRYANENEQILDELEHSLLNVRSHPQRLLEVLGSRVAMQYEMSSFLHEMDDALEAVNSLEQFTQNTALDRQARTLQMEELTRRYQQAMLDYQTAVEQLWEETDPMGVRPSTLTATRQEIFLQMTSGRLINLGYTFEQLSERLQLLGRHAEGKRIEAETDFSNAQVVRLFIVAISFALSLLTAIVVSNVLSRVIAHPLEQATKTAQRVTEEDNFTLRVPVVSTDEIGVLSNSLNGLIDRVHQLLEEQSERTIELEAATQEAQAANHAKSEFLANMNHELRTPLNGILGYTQILTKDEALTPKQQQGFATIHSCAEHLLTLISDILDLAKIEARKLELLPQDVYLKPFLQTTADICRIKAHQKGIAFYCEYDDTLPPAVRADEKRLRQVLINLLGNAIKFTDVGSVTLQIERLSPSPEMETARSVPIRFSVRDTGIGLRSDERKRIFQPFEQVAGRDRNATGTGLGLAICRQLVELMEGSIRLESQMGAGSCFCFDLQLEPVTEAGFEAAAIETDIDLEPAFEPDLEREAIVDEILVPAIHHGSSIPSAAELTPIYRETQGGFVNEIQSLAFALQEQNPDYTDFTSHLIALARQFEIEALLTFLEPHVEAAVCVQRGHQQ